MTRPDRAPLLADPERLEDHHRARRDGAALHAHPREHRQGRAVPRGVPGDLPNNRMPAIVDPDGPDGRPISIFESGAILQYLGRKSGRFYGASARERVEIEQWLFWQVGGVGPMAGQAHHFLKLCPGMSRRTCSPTPGPLPQRGSAALQRAGPPPRGPRLRRGRLLDRRHGDLALGEPLEGAGAGHRAVPEHEGLARPGRGSGRRGGGGGGGGGGEGGGGGGGGGEGGGGGGGGGRGGG